MECKITFTKSPRCSAFTLPEFLVATALGLMLMAGLSSLIVFSARSFATVLSYVDLDQKTRNAVDRVTTQIRKMDALRAYSSNSISFQRGSTNFTFTYDPAARTLTQSDGVTSTVLLTGCDTWTFAIYQRNTISNTFDQFPTSVSSNTCKLAQMNWSCSRTLLGQKFETESEQSAKVVIRREK